MEASEIFEQLIIEPISQDLKIEEEVFSEINESIMKSSELDIVKNLNSEEGNFSLASLDALNDCEKFERSNNLFLNADLPSIIYSDSSIGESNSSIEIKKANYDRIFESSLKSEGDITVEGDMIKFVSHNLNEIIKKNKDSPKNSLLNESRSASSESLSSSTSGWSNNVSTNDISKTHNPEDLPIIDSKVLEDLENYTQLLACNLDTVLKNVGNHLEKLSACSRECICIYKNCVDCTCDSVDSAIKLMYALMAKSEEMTKIIEPVYLVQKQVQKIKDLVDTFEKQLSDDE